VVSLCAKDFSAVSRSLWDVGEEGKGVSGSLGIYRCYYEILMCLRLG